MLTSRVDVAEQTTRGPLIRIEVSGKWPGGRGDELAELVRDALAVHDPFALCIDLCKVRGFLSADTLGGLVPQCIGKARGVVRPISVAAKGGTARGVRWFLEASRLSELADITLFDNALQAVEHLRRRAGRDAV